MDRVAQVRKAFNENLERYESWFSKDRGRMVKEIEVRAAKKLIPEGIGLEVGVGSGIFASALGVDYGIDPAKKPLRLAQSRGVKAIRGIGERLPFKDRKFDFLLFMFTLSFLADSTEALQEANRVLKQKGKLIVCFIPKESPWGTHYRKKKSEGHDFYKHARFFSVSEVMNLLEQSDFTRTKKISTLFQEPGCVEKIEEPVEEIRDSGGLCCFKAVKV